MKKIVIAVFTLMVVFTLAACGSTTDNLDDGVIDELLSSEESLATLSYLSAGFLNTTTEDPTLANLMFLADEETTEIEDELDTVNVYFDRLKSMIDNGVDSFGSVTEEVSDNELYQYKLTFTVNEEVYIIYYNLDDVTGEMTGIIVIGDVEYEFEVVDNMREYRYQEEEKNENKESNQNDSNNNEEENGNANQQDSDTEDDDLDDDLDDDVENEEEEEDEDEDNESETKMMLIATNGEDSIKIMYKTEVDDEESTTKFDMEQTIAGVTKHIALKISIEEDEYKITVEDGEDTFTFKQETEEDGVVEYKLTYNVNGVSGTVKIIETTDEFGEIIYEYKISEGNRQKDTERGRPDYDFDDEDELDDEEEVEDETEDETEA